MRVLTAAIAAFALLLTACTGSDPQPADTGSAGTPIAAPMPTASSPGTPAPSPSLSPSPSRTGPLTTGPGVRPGETPPVLSSFARQHTSAGALAFAGYYFKALDWSIATTDPYLVAQISAPDCQACKRVIDGLNALRADGKRLQGGRIRIISSKLVTGTFKVSSDYVVEVAADESAEVADGPSGAPSTVSAEEKSSSLVFVSWSGSGWQVVDVGAPS